MAVNRSSLIALERLFTFFFNALLSLLALLAALLVCVVFLRVSGHAPLQSLGVLVQGAVGGRYELTETAIKSCPLLFAGLGVTLAFRSGLFNIGADGQLLIGALAATWWANRFGGQFGAFSIVPILAAAFVAGGAWGGVAALLKTQRSVNEVISTLMLNFIAALLISYLVHGPMQEAAHGYPQTEMVPESLFLTRLLPPTRLHTGVLIALAAALVCYILMFHTPYGLQLRVSGLSPQAARVAGIDLSRNIVLTLFLSGGLAGLGGGVEVLGITRRLFDQFSPGYGFTANAVALLGQLHPLAVVPSAFFFGALDVGAGALQRVSGVSSALAGVIQSIVIVALVLGNAPPVRRPLESIARRMFLSVND